MTRKFPGGVIRGAAVVTTGGKNGEASGIWSTSEATQKTAGNLWPAPKTAPGAPSITSVTLLSGTSASISFTDPADNGGSSITGYTVTASSGGITGSGSSSPVTISGLTEGQTYTFTVTATNAYGTGPSSAASSPVVMDTITWVTASGSIGDVWSLSVATTTPTVQATSLSGSVNYSVVSGSLPSGASLNSSTGAITLGAVPGTDTTSNFTIRATAVVSGVSGDRAFSITMRYQRVTTFSATGGDQSFVVPAGPTVAWFKVWGAGGGAGHGQGGGGGFAGGYRSVSGGQSYTLRVGLTGSGGSGGFGGGGNGSEGYGGGGGSYVFFGGTAHGNIVVAAGGGGGQGCGTNCASSGGYQGGVGGGTTGGFGSFASCASGGGGTQSAGGDACSCNTLGTNQAGSAMQGGSSGYGGGGGGGYYGGGSGCRQGSWIHTAGGGGSGYTGGLTSNISNLQGSGTTGANTGDADRAANIGNSGNNGQITVRY